MDEILSEIFKWTVAWRSSFLTVKKFSYLYYFGVGSSSEKAMAPTPVLLPGESHGRRSLVGCSP